MVKRETTPTSDSAQFILAWRSEDSVESAKSSQSEAQPGNGCSAIPEAAQKGGSKKPGARAVQPAVGQKKKGKAEAKNQKFEALWNRRALRDPPAGSRPKGKEKEKPKIRNLRRYGAALKQLDTVHP